VEKADDVAEAKVDDARVPLLRTPSFARACAMTVKMWIGSNEGLVT
jgi:hypothetical protein